MNFNPWRIALVALGAGVAGGIITADRALPVRLAYLVAAAVVVVVAYVLLDDDRIA